MIEGLLQPMHLVLILGIVMIFFGPKRLPELGKGLGESIRGFKDSMARINEQPEAQKIVAPAQESKSCSTVNLDV